MDNVKTHIAKNRLYFLQDLKAVLQKHDALLEIEVEGYNEGYNELNFMYDLGGFDDPFERQTGNILVDQDGEFGVFELDILIAKELKEIEDAKQSDNSY